uniref:Transcriptional regulator n=1 Tax=Heterorhabditis bacteriophora TaxID=37862 RepID=A0A1I7WV63_HETBA
MASGHEENGMQISDLMMIKSVTSDLIDPQMSTFKLERLHGLILRVLGNALAE